MPEFTTVNSPHPSSPNEAELPTVTTNDNCIHPSLPPFQSPTTNDPSPPSVDNEEVVLLGVISPVEATTPAVNANTHAAGKDTTIVSDIIAFFNPQATLSKKPRCNIICGCFNIAPDASEWTIITCKNCTNFGVCNCIFHAQKITLRKMIYSHAII
jgi:hypothetical protein